MTVSNSFLRKNHNNLTPILSKLVKEKLKLKYFCFRVSGCIKLDSSPPQSYNIDKAETELEAPGGLDLPITLKYFFNGRKNEKRKELVSPIQKRWVKLCDFPGVFYNVIPGPPPALQTSGGLDKVTKPSPVSSLQSCWRGASGRVTVRGHYDVMSGSLWWTFGTSAEYLSLGSHHRHSPPSSDPRTPLLHNQSQPKKNTKSIFRVMRLMRGSA